jgi:hypothetical protein
LTILADVSLITGPQREPGALLSDNYITPTTTITSPHFEA